jgi:hypothetical protein
MRHSLSRITKERLVNIRQRALPFAAAAFLCFAPCFSSGTSAANAAEASFILTEKSLDDLRKKGLPNDIVNKLGALKDKKFTTEDEFLVAVSREIGSDRAVSYKQQILRHAADSPADINTISEMQKDLEQLEQRVKELETEKTAREEATRLIIRDALSTLGSKINESVSLGGTLEVSYGLTRDFLGRSEGVFGIDAAQLDIEIDANEWTKGSMILEYVEGTNVLFPTTTGFQTGVDRISIDTANITIGDPQRLPPFMTVGRIILPFGISTGDPVADVLSITTPLTVEVFELRNMGVEIGVGFPTPAPAPIALPVTPPPVRPLVINPLFGALSRALGYKPLPSSPPTPIIPKPAPPLFNVSLYSYDGAAYKGVEKYGGYRPAHYYGATAGFRTRGHCGHPFDQLGGSFFCPWSIDVSINTISSIFDSQFLASEYQKFLGQIGFVNGMAGSVKATAGPVSLVGEWNGATTIARFTDDLNKRVVIKPYAWQISLGYQFDWNPWVEVIGAQGDYLTIGYSQSHDLEGVNQVIDGPPTRVGFVPKKRFTVGAGEWVLSNLRFAIEYTYNYDYPKHEGGTGNSADAYFSQLTLVW